MLTFLWLLFSSRAALIAENLFLRKQLPKDLRELIRQMDRQNPTWAEERIADELLLKLGIRVSPRTVRKYLDSFRPPGCSGKTELDDFRTESCALHRRVRLLHLRNGIVPSPIRHCRHGDRYPPDLHSNVTSHPTAEWTIQQFREFLAFDRLYRFVIHDRDGIFSPEVELL